MRGEAGFGGVDMGAIGVNGRCSGFGEFRGTKRLSGVVALAANFGKGILGDEGFIPLSVIGAPITNALFRMSAVTCFKKMNTNF